MSTSGPAAITATVARNHLASLCKPPGSLGQLESLAADLCVMQNTLEPQTRPRHLTVFAADHGVTADGVSAWDSSVTRAVVELMQQRRTASGVLATTTDTTFEVVDIGLQTPCSPVEGGCLLDLASRRGTANLANEPAMTASEFDYAWQVGRDRADAAIQSGARVLLAGEMGIGNTTAASCLTAKLTGLSVHNVVGLGAGLPEEALSHKRGVVSRALSRIETRTDPAEVGREVGGLEIAAMAGFYTEAARQQTVVVLDGFIATAAALLAAEINPGVRDVFIAAHRSKERGHYVAVSYLGLTPLLALDMGLGEGTGALAALPLLDMAAAVTSNMATLDDLTFDAGPDNSKVPAD